MKKSPGRLLLLLAALASPARAAEPLTRCEDFKGPPAWSYCLTTTPGSANPDLLYYLHGKGGGKKSWASSRNYSAGIRSAWAEAGKDAPAVATVSFGSFWLLAGRNASAGSGLYEFFREKAMPLVESRLGAPPRSRLLLGESMGGFNGAELLLKEPKLFSRAALACPAIPGVSPYGGREAEADYLRRTHAVPWRFHMALKLLRSVYPDEAAWQAESPLETGRALLGAGTPPLHVSCGDRDDYGFFEAARAFAELAQARGVDAVWEPLSGGHCAVDPRALAAFLLP